MDTKGNFMLNVVEALLDDFRHRGIMYANLDDKGLEIRFDNLGFLLAFRDVKEQWKVEELNWSAANVYISNDHLKAVTYFDSISNAKKFLEKVGLDYGKQDKENSMGD